MKVLIATPLFPPDSGGPATYANLLAEEFPKKGIVVDVAVFSCVMHYPKIIRHALYFFVLLRKAFSADMIYALDPVSVGVPAYGISLLLQKPLYVRIAGDYAWEQGVQRFGVEDSLDTFVTKRNYPLIIRILKNIQTHIARSARRVVVPGSYLKKIISAWGVDPQKITVVYNAPPSEIEISRDNTYTKPYIVTMGRLVPWKGVAAIIDALLHINPQEVSLLIIGGGPEEHLLKTKVRDLKLEHRVTFTGPLPHHEALNIIAGGEVFVLNTGYEGFSHTLLEVFRCGVPIVTTHIGGNEELVTDGENALLVTFNDRAAIAIAINRLLADSNLREHLVAGARYKSKDYSREKTVEDSRKALSII